MPPDREAWRTAVHGITVLESDITEPLSTAQRHFLGFHDGSDGKESICNSGNLGREDPLEEKLATHSNILA